MKRRRSSAVGYDLNGTEGVYPVDTIKVAPAVGAGSYSFESFDDNDGFGQVLFPDFAPTSMAAS